MAERRSSSRALNTNKKTALDDLRRRLGRLGVTTGQDFVPKPRWRGGPDIGILIEGQIVETDVGTCFQTVRIYEPDIRHGPVILSEWLTQAPATLALIGGNDALMQTAPRHFVFLDVETTGLGTTGSLPFLVGIGFFSDEGSFAIQQFFLRDPAEEPAMLRLLLELFTASSSLVTFNGRSFDVPLLSSRFILNRTPSRIHAMPNLDLLPPARSLWRRRLSSCALSSLEIDVLGLHRTQEDIPGYLIPHLYQEYLQTGDASEMKRVFYHNEQDILSMVALGVTLSQAFERPAATVLPIDDRLSLARWHERLGLREQCEMTYRIALDEAPDAETRYDTLSGLAFLLKRADRRREAIPLWEDLADLKVDTQGHEELAKHYEWHDIDLPRALRWTEAGIALAQSWRPGLRRTETLAALEHRRARLLRKIAANR